jgi:hypothetical protein
MTKRLAIISRSMEQHVFGISTDYRGHHRKGVAIQNATLVNMQQNTWFFEQKSVFVSTTERF